MILINRKNKKAFTLIELLVVIAIIGILSTLVIVSLGDSRAKARDSKRLNDLKAMANALELYYADNNQYPSSLTPGDPLENNGVVYMNKIPNNPTPRTDGDCADNDYSYEASQNNSSYTINACIGSNAGSLLAGNIIATPQGIMEHLSDEVLAYIDRVETDGGIVEDPKAANDLVRRLKQAGVYNKATIISAAGGYKTGKLYSIAGPDFDVIRATAGTRTNKDGLIESMTNATPRTEYRNGSLRGTLAETQKTNLAHYSEQFDNGYWIKLRGLITADNHISPTGLQNADTFYETAVNDNHFVYRDMPVSSSTQYTFSIFVKSENGRNVRISENLGSSAGGVTVDLSNGTILGGNGVVEYHQNGWYRISITGVTGSAQVNWRPLAYSVNGTATSFLGDTSKGVVLWGAQLEIGPYASAYIPTTTTSVTRNADVIRKQSASSSIGQTEGFVCADLDLAKFMPLMHRFVIALSDGSTANRIQIGFGNTDPEGDALGFTILGTSIISKSSSATVQKGFLKICGYYNQVNHGLVINGVVQSVSTDLGSFSFSNQINQINVGSFLNLDYFVNDTIKGFVIGDQSLTEQEAILLTQ